jgi:hypothetical protein
VARGLVSPASSQDAYKQAGVKDARAEISMAEVHDCFTPTELVLMEDMGFSPRGQGWKDAMDGRFDGDGAQRINPDGGLKSFGHPIGASGLAHGSPACDAGITPSNALSRSPQGAAASVPAAAGGGWPRALRTSRTT